MDDLKPKPLLPMRLFLKKFSRNLLIGIGLILLSLGVGMVGYHHFEKMSWIDAYVNTSMILAGMGPVSTLQTTAGKLFAGSYALFCGIFFLVIIAIVFAPVIHRYLHKFHLDESNKK